VQHLDVICALRRLFKSFGFIRVVERGTSVEGADSLQTLSLKFCLAVMFLHIRLCCCKAISAVDKTVLRHTKRI